MKWGSAIPTAEVKALIGVFKVASTKWPSLENTAFFLPQRHPVEIQLGLVFALFVYAL